MNPENTSFDSELSINQKEEVEAGETGLESGISQEFTESRDSYRAAIDKRRLMQGRFVGRTTGMTGRPIWKDRDPGYRLAQEEEWKLGHIYRSAKDKEIEKILIKGDNPNLTKAKEELYAARKELLEAEAEFKASGYPETPLDNPVRKRYYGAKVDIEKLSKRFNDEASRAVGEKTGGISQDGETYWD